MMVKNLIFLLIMLSSFTQCVQKQLNSPEKISKSGLQFEHMGYRGSGYTDAQERKYNLRVNPITITNENTVPVHIQLDFSKAYDYPAIYGNEQFKVIPLPKEWAGNGTTDSMFNKMYEKLPNYIEQPTLKAMIAPGEKIKLAIGTLYPTSEDKWSVVPNQLFASSDGETFSTCDWRMKKKSSSNSEIMLGLKLTFTESCLVIPCGQISYQGD